MYVLLLGIIRFTPLSSDCGLGSCSWCRWWWWQQQTKKRQQQNTTNAAYHHHHLSHHTQHHSIYIHLFPQKTHTLFCTLYSLCFVVSSSSGSRFFNTRVCVCKFPSLNLSVSEFKCNHHLQPHDYDNLEMKYKLAKRKKVSMCHPLTRSLLVFTSIIRHCCPVITFLSDQTKIATEITACFHT